MEMKIAGAHRGTIAAEAARQLGMTRHKFEKAIFHETWDGDTGRIDLQSGEVIEMVKRPGKTIRLDIPLADEGPAGQPTTSPAAAALFLETFTTFERDGFTYAPGDDGAPMASKGGAFWFCAGEPGDKIDGRTLWVKAEL